MINEAIEYLEAIGFFIVSNADTNNLERYRMINRKAADQPGQPQIYYFYKDQELIDFAEGVKKIL